MLLAIKRQIHHQRVRQQKCSNRIAPHRSSKILIGLWPGPRRTSQRSAQGRRILPIPRRPVEARQLAKLSRTTRYQDEQVQ